MASALNADDISHFAVKIVDRPAVYLSDVPYTIKLDRAVLQDTSEGLVLLRDGQAADRWTVSELNAEGGNTEIADVLFKRSGTYTLTDNAGRFEIAVRVIPGWLSLLPPLLAIFLALLWRQVLIALFAGIWLGAVFIYDYNPFSAFLYTLTEYIGKAPADAERIAILIFSLTLGGMVGVISKSGGTQGIVQKLSSFARDRKRGQIATWLTGVIIFFDDYANTLIVGNTMRPITDKLKISREKLSYLVDSTAAPVANIAVISTWIGYELSLLNDAFEKIGYDQNAYITFFRTIPYNYYPIFALIFGLAVAWFGRDFFSMYKAEKRAWQGKGLLSESAVPLADVNSKEMSPKEGIPLRWYNALIPVLTVIVTVLAGLWFTGLQGVRIPTEELERMGLIRYISTVIGQSDSFAVLMWAAFIGSIVAILMAIGQRLLTLNDAMLAWVGGVKAMVMAALILTMAWAIGNICGDLQTAEYVVSVSRDLLSPHLLPLLSFLIAGAIAFATGTSWGTMAILTPIVIPLAYQLPQMDPTISVTVRTEIFLSAIASILAGATFGDHCSPISDTTIMSSMASGADHIDHVRTQLPYALMAAGFSIVFGYLPAGLGLHDAIILTAGLIALVLFVRFAGKKVTSDA